MPSYDECYDQTLLADVRDDLVWIADAVHKLERQDMCKVLAQTVRLFEDYYNLPPRKDAHREEVESDELDQEALRDVHAELWSMSLRCFDQESASKYRLIHETVRRFELQFMIGPQSGFWEESVSSEPMAGTAYRIIECEGAYSVEENTGSGFVGIATLTHQKDADEFVKLKRGQYTEVTDTWLGHEAFFQRFRQFYRTHPDQAKRVIKRLVDL